jgi:hypothetical protein
MVTVWLAGCVLITGQEAALAVLQKAIPMTAGKAKLSSDPAKARVARRESRETPVFTTPETKERILRSMNAPSAGQYRWPSGLRARAEFPGRRQLNPGQHGYVFRPQTAMRARRTINVQQATKPRSLVHVSEGAVEKQSSAAPQLHPAVLNINLRKTSKVRSALANEARPRKGMYLEPRNPAKR